MRLLVPAALSCLLVACGFTAPRPEQLDPEKLTAPLQGEIQQSQKAAKYASDRLEAQIQAMSRDAQAASQGAAQVAEEARRSAQVAAEMPHIVVRDKIVPVIDSAFRPGDRENLLSRAAEHSQRLQEAVAQLHDLGAKVQDMQTQVSGLQEFASSPGSFVETHGISGLVALVLSIASYLVGKRKRA